MAAAQGCISCHGDNLQGSIAGPSLVDMKHTVEEIKDIAVNGYKGMPGGIFKGTDEELDELANFLVELKSK